MLNICSDWGISVTAQLFHLREACTFHFLLDTYWQHYSESWQTHTYFSLNDKWLEDEAVTGSVAIGRLRSIQHTRFPASRVDLSVTQLNMHHIQQTGVDITIIRRVVTMKDGRASRHRRHRVVRAGAHSRWRDTRRRAIGLDYAARHTRSCWDTEGRIEAGQNSRRRSAAIAWMFVACGTPEVLIQAPVYTPVHNIVLVKRAIVSACSRR